MKNPFHLAIPVNDLAEADNFYQHILGCEKGRSSESWIDFNLFGHQLVCHCVKQNQSFVIEPKIRFKGKPGEQRTMFLQDPSGNAIEFKAFKSLNNLFKS